MADGVDIARLGLELDGRRFIDTSRSAASTLDEVGAAAKRTETATKSLERATESAAQAQGRASRAFTANQQARITSAQASLDQMERVFRQEMAFIREAQVRGFLSPTEARQAGQDAATAFNQGVLSELDQLSSAGITDFGSGGQLTKIREQIKDVGGAGRTASIGMHRLNNSLVVLTRQAAGAHPVVGQLVDVVGTFAIGTARMVPVLAGLAAIAFAWNEITREAREASKAQEEALKRLEALGELQGADRIQADVDAARELLAELDRRRAAAQYDIRRGGSSGLTGDIGAQARLRAIDEEYAAAEQKIELGEQRLAEIRRRETKEGLDQLDQQLDESLRERLQAIDARYDQMQSAIERNERAIAEAGARAAARFRMPQEMDGAALARAIGSVIDLDVIDDQKIERANAAVERLLSTWREGTPSVERAMELQAEINRLLASMGLSIDDTVGSLQREYEGLGSIIRDLGDEAEDGAQRFEVDWAAALRTVGGEFGSFGAQASRILATLVSEVDRLMQSGQGFGSALSGGLQAAGPLAFAGVGAWAIDQTRDIFGNSGGRTEVESRRLLEENNAALERVARNLEEYGSQLAGMTAQQVDAFRQWLAWANGTGARGGIPSTINEDTFRFFGLDPSDRSHETFAEVQRLVEQALEDAFEEIQRRVVPDFAARAAEVMGDEREAARIRREAAAAREREELERLAEAGFISAQQLQEFNRIIGEELVKALDEAERAAQEAALALSESLVTRGLRALGLGAEADLFEFQSRQRQERFDLRNESPAMLQLLTLVQNLEEETFLRRQAIASQIEAIRSAAQAQIDKYDEQIRIAEDQRRLAQEQLQEQRTQVRELQQTVDALSKFGRDLRTGPDTFLSPMERLQAARGEFEALRALALGGDAGAARAFPGVADTFLDALRAVFGSSAMFQDEFEGVLSTVDLLEDKFGRQLSVEERMLEQLEAQNDALQSQIQELQEAREQARADAERQIAQLQAEAQAASHRSAEQILFLRSQLEELQRQTNILGPMIHPPQNPDDLTKSSMEQALSAQVGNKIDTSNSLLGQIVNRLDNLEGAVGRNTDETRRGWETMAATRAEVRF